LSEVGGLVGRNIGSIAGDNGIIADSSATGSINAFANNSVTRSNFGGLVGRNGGGAILRSYATGVVLPSKNPDGTPIAAHLPNVSSNDLGRLSSISVRRRNTSILRGNVAVRTVCDRARAGIFADQATNVCRAAGIRDRAECLRITDNGGCAISGASRSGAERLADGEFDLQQRADIVPDATQSFDVIGWRAGREVRGDRGVRQVGRRRCQGRRHPAGARA
jgi:hypothetical protein